jgi:hypothetical protein
MLNCRLPLVFAVLCSTVSAQPSVVDHADVLIESSPDSIAFQLPGIPPPAVNDAAADAEWKLVAGRSDANSGPLNVLNDGRIPTAADQPRSNWFLAAGTTGGLILLDLKKPLPVSQIVSYSWHPGQRSAQMYAVYASGTADAPVALPESASLVPTTPGWSLIASVDTRSQASAGGQVAARITLPADHTHSFRYLLFVLQATDPNDRFSHTFFSEIDVVTGKPSTLRRIEAPPTRELRFATADGQYKFTIDTTQAEELEQWTAQELQPVIREWYPRIVQLLPSRRFEAPRQVLLRYLRDAEMRGVPAYASGNTISLNAEWMRGQLKREARGAVVHELVHVVQQYSGRRRGPAGNAPPGWLVEGIPDYIRWFLYEPETGGAKLSVERRRTAQHDGSYRVSANFLDFVIRTHPVNPGILEQLNAAAREGRYSSEIWQQLTGKTEQQLADSWRETLD